MHELLYKQTIDKTKEVDLLTQDMPLIKTGYDPIGSKPPSEATVRNRRQAVLTVWRHLGNDGKPDRQQMESITRKSPKPNGNYMAKGVRWKIKK